jgi:hypothetical protein
MYNIHLQGVHNIVEAAGGAEILIPRLPKLRAQLAMFIWQVFSLSLLLAAINVKKKV